MIVKTNSKKSETRFLIPRIKLAFAKLKQKSDIAPILWKDRFRLKLVYQVILLIEFSVNWYQKTCANCTWYLSFSKKYPWYKLDTRSRIVSYQLVKSFLTWQHDLEDWKYDVLFIYTILISAASKRKKTWAPYKSSEF